MDKERKKKPKDKYEQSMTCRVCGETLPSYLQLEKHYKTHVDSDQKPYVCSDCGKQFGHRSNLATHIKLHTGDKPYLCEFCGKQDSDIGNLFKHMKVHEEKKERVVHGPDEFDYTKIEVL